MCAAGFRCAFNVLLRDTGRWFWPIFACGNLTVLPGLAALDLLP